MFGVLFIFKKGGVGEANYVMSFRNKQLIVGNDLHGNKVIDHLFMISYHSFILFYLFINLIKQFLLSFLILTKYLTRFHRQRKLYLLYYVWSNGVV